MHPRLEGAAIDEGGQGHHVTHNTAEIVAQSDQHKAITAKGQRKSEGSQDRPSTGPVFPSSTSEVTIMYSASALT